MVERREPERGIEIGKRDFDGLGRFERPVPVPVEVEVAITLVSVGKSIVDLTPVSSFGSVRFVYFIWASSDNSAWDWATQPQNHRQAYTRGRHRHTFVSVSSITYTI